MSSESWGQRTDADTAYRRASGRRAHNAKRAAARDRRRVELFGLLVSACYPKRGALAKVARALGVHRSTVTRDLQAMYAADHEFHATGRVTKQLRLIRKAARQTLARVLGPLAGP